MALALLRTCGWEDPAILPVAEPDDDVLVVEASGDDALGLLGARSVTAIVPSREAMALVDLKRVAARELPRQSVLSLLGFGHFGRRIWFYHHLRPELNAAARQVWDSAEPLLRTGLCAGGTVEREMGNFQRLFPALVSARAPQRLAAASTLEEHRRLLDGGWGLRWSAALAIAAPRLARAAGGSEEGAVHRARELLRASTLAENPFVSWMILGRPADPPQLWLTTAGFARARANIDALTVRVGSRHEVLSNETRRFSLVVLGRAPLSAEEMSGLHARLRVGGRAVGWGRAPPGAVPLGGDRGLFPGPPWLYRR